MRKRWGNHTQTWNRHLLSVAIDFFISTIYPWFLMLYHRNTYVMMYSTVFREESIGEGFKIVTVWDTTTKVICLMSFECKESWFQNHLFWRGLPYIWYSFVFQMYIKVIYISCWLNVWQFPLCSCNLTIRICLLALFLWEWQTWQTWFKKIKSLLINS